MTLTTGTAIHFFGVTVATTLSLPEVCGNDQLWPILPFVSALFAVLHLISSNFLPPSPKHLYITRRERDEARIAIRFYHGDHVDEGNLEPTLADRPRGGGRVRASHSAHSHLCTTLLLCFHLFLFFSLI
jgi:hypothetical protein